jgi:Fe-S-cluster containining protein
LLLWKDGLVDLVQVIDAAMSDAVRKSGDWIACRAGCFECCIGPFEITQLDAQRLRDGLAVLDPERAARVRRRAREYAGGDDEACPALDPEAGTCDLYDARPLTCRVFGPAVRSHGGIGACELCYVGASDGEIAACAVELDLSVLDDEHETTVAMALK